MFLNLPDDYQYYAYLNKFLVENLKIILIFKYEEGKRESCSIYNGLYIKSYIFEQVFSALDVQLQFQYESIGSN